ncbi:MAG: extracellular solute-binding protein [Ruminococcaceae bacterium]|nr:extracellular solute-binding protein [Oscillospiraceae bacterium]
MLKMILALSNKGALLFKKGSTHYLYKKPKGRFVMKKTAIRLLALVLSLVMCLTLGACGGKGDAKSQPVSSEEETFDELGGDIDFEGTVSGAESENADTNKNSGGKGNSNTAFKGETAQSTRLDVFKNIPKNLKGTTVTFAHWGDEGGAEYVKVAKAFTKLTGINVKWQLYDQTTYEADIAKQIVAGQGPDIIILNDKIPQIYEIAGELPKIFNVKDGFWDPRITEQTKFKGKSYFVNSYYSPYVPTAGIVVYNKKIFNDNGLKSPVDYINEGKWTWENFKQCMLDADKIGYYGGVLDPYLMSLTMGPGFISYDAKTGKMSTNKKNNAMLKSLKFYAECREEGLCGNYLIAQYPAGNIAMLTTDAYAIKKNGYLKDMSASDFGAVRMPDSFEGKKCNYGGVGIRAYIRLYQINSRQYSLKAKK